MHPSPLLTEGVARHIIALLGVQSDDANLLSLELGDESGLGLLDLFDGLRADRHQRFDGFGSVLNVLDGQLDRALDVVALDGLLDEFGPHVGALATDGAVDAGATEVVGVLQPIAACRDAIGQPLAAVAAEDAAAQVVPVLLRPLARHPLFVKQALYLVEGVLVDQGLMATVEGLLLGCAALVDKPAHIKGVAQHALPGGDTNLAFGISPGRHTAQTKVVEVVGELGDGVFAAGVEPKAGRNEMSTLRVWRNDADLATIR